MTGGSRGAPADPAVVGRVVRPHGLAGDVVVEPVDPSSAACAEGSEAWLAGSWRRVLARRPDNKGRWIVRLHDVADADAAESLRGAELMIEATELPRLEAGRYYVHELVGCSVRDTGGRRIGEVVAVVPGPQDWLEVEHAGGRSLVPMVRALLKKVDLGERCIVIDPPAGLVEATRD